MIDALLHTVRDSIRANLGYDVRTCDIRPDGQPPPRCGDIFLAVHQGTSRSDMLNALNEYFNFSVTLTMRCTNVPYDRVGDQLLSRDLAQKLGFNRRAEAARALLHDLNGWAIITAANAYLVRNNPTETSVYGFCEPARYGGMEVPILVGGEWFSATPEAKDVGLKAEMRFEDVRRLQALFAFT